MKNLGGRSNVSRPVEPVGLPARPTAGTVGGIDTATFVPQVPVDLTESFNKANGSPVGPDLTWQAFGSSTGAVINSNTVIAGADSESGAVVTTAAVSGTGLSYPYGGFEPNMTVSVDVVDDAGGTGGLSLIARAPFNGLPSWALLSCYEFVVYSSGGSWYYLLRYYSVGGGGHTIDSAGPLASPAGSRLELSCVGSSITATGVASLSGTDTTLGDGTGIEFTHGSPYFGGVFFNTATASAQRPKLDNFELVGTLPGYLA